MTNYLTVVAGDTVADTLYHRSPAALVAAGYKGVAIYWKNTDAAQIAKYHAAGLGVLLIHEWKRTDGDTGYTGGLTHGKQAAAAAARLGYPRDLPMIFANDENTTATNIAAHVAHWKGCRTAYQTYYQGMAGLYGDRDLMAALASPTDKCGLSTGTRQHGPGPAAATFTTR